MVKRWVSGGRVFVGVWACLAVLQGSRSAAQTWREVDSPHFQVVTNGTEKDGRDVAKEFEQMRSVLAERLNNPKLETGAPLMIFAITEPALQDLAPSQWKDRDKVGAEFFHGWERQYAMVKVGIPLDASQYQVFHEYTHSVFHANVHWLPMWLDEGMAEFYGYTRFQDGRTYLGAPSLRYDYLRGEKLLPITEMVSIKPGTLWTDPLRRSLFYAEAWAMVDYMTLGKGMGNGAKLNAYIALLEKRTPPLEAFTEVFGDPKKFGSRLEDYMSEFLIRSIVLPQGEMIDAQAFSTRVLSAAEAEYKIGCFNVGLVDFATARKRLEAAEAGDPALAGPHEELGFMAWGRGKDEEARAEWRQAVAADAGMYRSAFALVMSGKPLREQSEEELEATRLALVEIKRKALTFAPVTVEMALVEWRQGDLKKAYQDAVSAQTMEPWRAGYRLLAGYLLLAAGHATAAAEDARIVAERWTRSDHDEAVDLWNLVPASARGDGPPLTYEMPAKASVVRGTIVSTTCANKVVTVRLEPDAANAEVVTLVSGGPIDSGFFDSIWEGHDHYTMCFHVAGLPAVAAYEAGADGTRKLVDLEVGEDLPEVKVPGSATASADAQGEKR